MSEQDRDVLGHLEAASKELIAAARDALEVADEVLSDQIRLLGAFLGRRHGSAEPPTVERIDVDPGGRPPADDP